MLLRPLPYPNPQQIVRVWEQAPDGHRMSLADPNFEDFRAQNHTLTGLALYNDGPESVSGGSEPVRMNVAAVSSDFFYFHLASSLFAAAGSQLTSRFSTALRR